MSLEPWLPLDRADVALGAEEHERDRLVHPGNPLEEAPNVGLQTTDRPRIQGLKVDSDAHSLFRTLAEQWPTLAA